MACFLPRENQGRRSRKKGEELQTLPGDVSEVRAESGEKADLTEENAGVAKAESSATGEGCLLILIPFIFKSYPDMV